MLDSQQLKVLHIQQAITAIAEFGRIQIKIIPSPVLRIDNGGLALISLRLTFLLIAS